MDTVQLKITVPANLFVYLQSKADQFGITPSSYVRHLILKDVEGMDIPTFSVTKKVEDAYARTQQADKDGKLVEVESTSDFFANL